jgi:hypothetical protein
LNVVQALLIFTTVRRNAVLGLLIAAAGCGAGHQSPDPDAGDAVPPLSPTARRGEFVADPAIDVGHEAYVCYSFDVQGISDVHIGRVTWHPPTGPVLLHHASLFAAGGLPDVGEVPCDPMPTRVAALGVYTPGIEPLQLPDGVAVELPAGTQRLLVLAHAIRVDAGPANPTYVDLELAAEPVLHSANWVDDFGPVPTLDPGESTGSIGRCLFAQPTHIVSVWPHMHRMGAEFHGVVVRADGTREALLDVKPWDYDHQLIYPVDVQLEAGDVVETQCHWTNTTDHVVGPGPYSTDEMCNQGLLVWPFDSALCAN